MDEDLKGCLDRLWYIILFGHWSLSSFFVGSCIGHFIPE